MSDEMISITAKEIVKNVKGLNSNCADETYDMYICCDDCLNKGIILGLIVGARLGFACGSPEAKLLSIDMSEIVLKAKKLI